MGGEMAVRIVDIGVWRAQAACVGHGDLFFEDHMRTVVNKAKRICDKCAVKQECLDYALRNNEEGVWGGLTANERRKVKRIAKKAGLAK
jgi:WhiB family redox-sensing transcriptional regulator